MIKKRKNTLFAKEKVAGEKKIKEDETQESVFYFFFLFPAC
jgi:hypothetical protein